MRPKEYSKGEWCSPSCLHLWSGRLCAAKSRIINPSQNLRNQLSNRIKKFGISSHKIQFPSRKKRKSVFVTDLATQKRGTPRLWWSTAGQLPRLQQRYLHWLWSLTGLLKLRHWANWPTRPPLPLLPNLTSNSEMPIMQIDLGNPIIF